MLNSTINKQTKTTYLLLLSSVKFKEPPTESLDPQITSPCHYSTSFIAEVPQDRRKTLSLILG